jgi:hypothetical protein
MKNKNEQVPPDPNRPRKPYQQPKLQVYGDLREITQSHATGMKMDGGMGGGMNKTT